MTSKSSQLSAIAVSLILLTATIRGQTAQAPEAAAGGVAPAPQKQVPSTQTVVTYTNGQLTIEAKGAPLIDVLRSTCLKIQAELDAQAQPTDPTSGTFGPGSPKDVLGELLSNAHVNYALGGSTEDANVVANVTILPQAEDHGVSMEAPQEQKVQPQDPLSAGVVRSGSSQMMELIDAARPALASGVNLDQNLEETDLADGGGHVDLSAIAQQIEAQIKSAGQSVTGSAQNHQSDTASSDASGINSTLVNPTHRPMHRKHH